MLAWLTPGCVRCCVVVPFLFCFACWWLHCSDLGELGPSPIPHGQRSRCPRAPHACDEGAGAAQALGDSCQVRHPGVRGASTATRHARAQPLTVVSHALVLACLFGCCCRYKHGLVERGRTMFEGIVSSYPKRVDMWNMYLDQEISRGTYAPTCCCVRKCIMRCLHTRQGSGMVSRRCSCVSCDSSFARVLRRCANRSSLVRTSSEPQAVLQEDTVLLQEVHVV